MNEATMKDVAQFFDNLSEDQHDGMTKHQFMAEVKKVLDPKRNAGILDGMVEMRHQHRVAREEKARIDRATEKSKLGLR